MIKYNLTTENDTNGIEGYDNLLIEQLDQVINGTVESMVCEVLDKLDYNLRVKTIINMVKKLSFDGELILRFTNAYQLCKNIFKGEMSSKSLSAIVENTKSLFLESDMLDLINQINHVKIIKLYNSNNSIIMSLKKVND